MAERTSFQAKLLIFLVLLAYAAVFFFVIPVFWHWIWFAVGVVSGVGLLILDETTGYRWYQEKGEPAFLVSRSPLFLLSLIPLSVIVLTSFGNVWASGFIGGMTLFLLLEMIELRHSPEAFQTRFLRKVKTKISLRSINMLLLGALIFFLLIHLLAIL